MPVNLAEVFARLDLRHRTAWQWFVDHAGTVEQWPDPLKDGTLLATRAKGIYKPEWSNYALSVRQTLDSAYGDRDPQTRVDSTWTYAYHQEETQATRPEDLFTRAMGSFSEAISTHCLTWASSRSTPQP
jgi:putative restriction endonuclease